MSHDPAVPDLVKTAKPNRGWHIFKIVLRSLSLGINVTCFAFQLTVWFYWNGQVGDASDVMWVVAALVIACKQAWIHLRR
jgi:hypothetical protein